MMGLFVTHPWPLFYKKGMKTWEIRSYPTDYRGKVLIIESKTNTVISLVELIDCVPLSRELWEMNFEKHRVSYPFDSLPYKKRDGNVYAWVLKNPAVFDEKCNVTRSDSRPYITLEDNYLDGKKYHPIDVKNERLACKFLGDTMLVYWLKNNYFALIAIVDVTTGTTKVITTEIKENEVDYVLEQINAK